MKNTSTVSLRGSNRGGSPTSLNPEKDRATHLSRHRVSPLSVLTFPNLESRSIVGYARFVEPAVWEDDI